VSEDIRRCFQERIGEYTSTDPPQGGPEHDPAGLTAVLVSATAAELCHESQTRANGGTDRGAILQGIRLALANQDYFDCEKPSAL